MNCLSLFSGCGGLDLGLHRAGFKIIAAIDNDPHCAASHRENFPNTQFYEGRLQDLTPTAVSRLLSQRSRQIDLVAGGPPCPPFSKSRFYLKHKPRALEDPLGFSSVQAYLKIVRMTSPSVFLMENVPGFAFGVHDGALKMVVNAAKRMGYTCSWRVLNAADYGVPQIRERFFLVASRYGVFKFPSATHCDPLKLNSNHRPWATAGTAIADLDTEANADDTGHFAGGKHHGLLKLVPPGDNYLFFTEKRGYPKPCFRWRSRYWSFLLKLSQDRPSWTIQARRSNNMGPFHWRNRILRIEEIKRLQTFPDDWFLSGSTEQQWRQIGNAVPPLFAHQLGQAIRKHIAAHAGALSNVRKRA
jgi:DNA (cytosine-5)-methyltransferase 1